MLLVVSQPMFLPWLGLFEQVRLADLFVHYDDVQLPQGRSFITRVQIKTPAGPRWLSASIDRNKSGRLIGGTVLAEATGWRARHLALLRENYRDAPHFDVMFDLAQRLYAIDTNDLAEFNCTATELIASWLGLETDFVRSSSLSIGGKGSERLRDICRQVGATGYLTGHGAANYLDHELLESSGVSVSYLDYALPAYPQLYGEFTPYVSILDAIANTGDACRGLLTSTTIDWREFIRTRA